MTRTTEHAQRASAHEDRFVLDRLPERALWPAMDYSALPELSAYPPRMNCTEWLLDLQVARGIGHRPCILSPTERWSYRDLQERVSRIAGVLVEDLGLRPGNRVLLRGFNTPMMAACWLAVLKAGGICVTTMPLLRERELAGIARKAEIRLALTDVRLAGELDRAAGSVSWLERVMRFGGAEEELERAMAGQSTEFRAVDTAADDPALIAFTSGTTGQPKGTVHFHRDLLAICDSYARHVLRPGHEDVFCGSPPLAFTFGLGGLLVFPLHAGAATLLLEQGSPPQLMEAIARHRPTICFTAPTAYRAMADAPRSVDLSSLRVCVSAGETLPRSTFEAFRGRTGISILDGIGTTELLHIFISSPAGEVRPGATGRPVPGYEAVVVDTDGQVLPPGEVGRLAVRGPTGCRYLDDPARQRDYVQDGWNFTGDAFLRDEDGYFWYQARTDDLIVSAGYNIAGPEIESVLLEHESVLECGVVGVPDEARGQVVKAFVVLREGVSGDDRLTRELQDFVKREIAPYKYPRQIEFVGALPRTQTGKLQRFRLRERES